MGKSPATNNASFQQWNHIPKLGQEQCDVINGISFIHFSVMKLDKTEVKAEVSFNGKEHEKGGVSGE